MIPTRVRIKLPGGLSYPIGAEAVSEALERAPHAGELSISFAGGPAWRASECRRIFEERRPYAILAARYQPRRPAGYSGSNAMAAVGWYDEAWTIEVRAVPSGLRAIAARLLRAEGLPAVARWLGESDRPGWKASGRQVELVFDPADGSLSARERVGV